MAGYDLDALAVAYERDGLVVVPSLIDHRTIDAVRSDMEDRWSDRSRGSDRIQDLWLRSCAVRDLAADESVTGLLGGLYGRRPIPFQTLNFARGTAQPLHADEIHFDTVPSGWMCGAWVALEDVGGGQGPLRWVPGSHRGPAVDPEPFGSGVEPFDDVAYEDAVRRLVDAQGWPVRELHLNAGDVVVWSAGVLHGGAPVTLPGSTRYSQVTHYVFAGRPAVTPQRSIPSLGHWSVRDPLINVATGRIEAMRDESGRALAARPVGGGLHSLHLKAELSGAGLARAGADRRARLLRAVPRRVRASWFR